MLLSQNQCIYSYIDSGAHGEMPSNQKIPARALLMWSGNRSFEESIPTIHWCPDDLLTKGVLQFVFKALLFFSTRRWGGLHSSRWTRVNGKSNVLAMRSRFDLGVEVFTPRSGAGVTSCNLSWDHLYALASQYETPWGLLKVLDPWPNNLGISLHKSM